MMTDLDAIRARAEAATEGPWHINPDNGTHIIRTRNGDLVAQAGWTEPREQGLRNAAFIAHAREDIPALLALIDEQQAEIDLLTAEVERLQTEVNAAKAFGGGFYGEQVEEGTRDVYRRNYGAANAD